MASELWLRSGRGLGACFGVVLVGSLASGCATMSVEKVGPGPAPHRVLVTLPTVSLAAETFMADNRRASRDGCERGASEAGAEVVKSAALDGFLQATLASWGEGPSEEAVKVAEEAKADAILVLKLEPRFFRRRSTNAPVAYSHHTVVEVLDGRTGATLRRAELIDSEGAAGFAHDGARVCREVLKDAR